MLAFYLVINGIYITHKYVSNMTVKIIMDFYVYINVNILEILNIKTLIKTLYVFSSYTYNVCIYLSIKENTFIKTIRARRFIPFFSRSQQVIIIIQQRIYKTSYIVHKKNLLQRSLNDIIVVNTEQATHFHTSYM